MTDVEEQGGDGSVAVDVDHAQGVGQVALSGAHEEQPLETQKYATERWWVGADNKGINGFIDNNFM